MKILVIEDEIKVAKFLKKGLQQSGYEVDVALDGMEGYDKSRDNECDLILIHRGRDSGACAIVQCHGRAFERVLPTDA